MSRGKHLSLEEAVEQGKLDRFCKEHPSVADKKRFDALLNAMANPKNLEEGGKT